MNTGTHAIIHARLTIVTLECGEVRKVFPFGFLTEMNKYQALKAARSHARWLGVASMEIVTPDPLGGYHVERISCL